MIRKLIDDDLVFSNKHVRLDRTYTCEFDLPKTTSPWIIMAGLFPPADSIPHLPHKNATSMQIRSFLRDDFGWIDLSIDAPLDLCSDFDQPGLLERAKSDVEFRENWGDRLEIAINQQYDAGHIPVVYLCGKICNSIFPLLSIAQQKQEEISMLLQRRGIFC